MSVVEADTVERQFTLCSRDFHVRAYQEAGNAPLYVHADYEHDHDDLLEILAALDERGWEAIPEDEEEAVVTDTGVRIEFRRKLYKPHNQKIIVGLLSTPVLVGLGALAASVERWMQMVTVVVG